MRNFVFAVCFFALAKLGHAQTTEEVVPHAECTVIWTLDTACETAQTAIVDQMLLWDCDYPCGTPENATEPSGQKCLYEWLGDYEVGTALVTFGTHTTPIHRYVDDLRFTFQLEDNNGGCKVNGNSISQTESITDAGTNYCNIFNLMDGSGLTQDPGYTETTSDDICTQYSVADCEIY